MQLKGHRALITGAGQGIGKACARVFAARGAELVLIDKNPDTLGAVRTLATERGVGVTGYLLDLLDTDRLSAVLTNIVAAGGADILVNNAGFDRPGTSDRITEGDFEQVLRIQLRVPLRLIQALLPGMRTAGWGRIVNIGSIYGSIGAKGELAYATAKAGVVGLTKSVARECAKDGVTVNAVLPGLTRTPTIETFMADRYKEAIVADTPAGRMGEPEEIAAVVAFLASKDASFVTGAAVPVSGGWGV
jgi:3-oxoacyl-[acyl-carrier protein] reductase